MIIHITLQRKNLSDTIMLGRVISFGDTAYITEFALTRSCRVRLYIGVLSR
jgi:hypothetical protein